VYDGVRKAERGTRKVSFRVGVSWGTVVRVIRWVRGKVGRKGHGKG